MALDIASAQIKLRDLTAKFDNRLTSATPFYPSVCYDASSVRSGEKYGWIGNMPGMREWLGERQFSELRSANFVIENKHWESSLSIKKTDLADDNLGQYGPVLEQMGIEAAHHPDELFFDVLEDGASTACFDGQFFYDTDHAWGLSGTQSNDITSTVVSTSAPTVAEIKTAIRAMVKQLLGLKNDQGKLYHRPTVGRMNDLLLLVPLALRDLVFDAIESQLLSNSSNVVVDRPQIVASPYLTSDVKLYLFKTGEPVKPFVFQRREPLSRMMKGLDDLETKDVKFMTEARYNVGYFAWWTSVLCTLTT
jgi:phage major head subunit gpT-like protein